MRKEKTMTIKQMKHLMILVIGLSLSTSGVLAQARMGQRQRPTFNRAGQGRILMVLKAKQEELKITDEQLEKIKSLSLIQQEKALKHRTKQAELGLELRKVMMDRENLDYSKLKEVLTQRSALSNERFIERLKDREAIAAVFTPEQQEALKSLRWERFRRDREFKRDRIPRQDRDRARDPHFNRFRKESEDTWF
jgi:Spy/CpxP family protein refolding chaperone